MERATSANNTVTCLYSADWVAGASGEPHSLQNFAVAPNRAPHAHETLATVRAPGPSPSSSTSVSCHRWSDLSAISHRGPCPPVFTRPMSHGRRRSRSVPLLITGRSGRPYPLANSNDEPRPGFPGLLAADCLIPPYCRPRLCARIVSRSRATWSRFERWGTEDDLPQLGDGSSDAGRSGACGKAEPLQEGDQS